ncbi:MAG: glycoside hydrolase family 104 protein [Telluria sp.]
MNQNVIIAAALIAALIILKSARENGVLEGDPEDQTGSVLDQLPDFEDLAAMAQDTMMQTNPEQESANIAAMLMVIRKAEGTASDEGYRALFGWRPGNGKTFSSFATHPRTFFTYTDRAGSTIRTSAAGAYQITATTFDGLARNYGFSSFSEDAQDAMAVALIKERGALADVKAGRFETALRKIRPVWASLPGAGVNQPERSMDFVKTAFVEAGGQFA